MMPSFYSNANTALHISVVKKRHHIQEIRKEGEMLLKFAVLIATGLLVLSVSSQSFAIPPGTYTLNLNPLLVTLNVKADMSFTESFDLLTSTNPAPSCVVAGILGKVGNKILALTQGGGSGCGPVFGPSGLNVGDTTIGSNGAITLKYTNKTGTFTATLTRSTRIPDGLYTTAKGASISALLKVLDSKYYFAWNASGVNFGCFAAGTLIGGPVNAMTVDTVFGTANWQQTDKSKCADVSKVSYSGGKVTIAFAKGSADLTANSAAAWAQPQTYCGVIGSWSVNMFIKPDSTMSIEFLENAFVGQPSANYCAFALGYARTLDGSLRSVAQGSVGDCASALAAINTVTKLTWTATSVVVTTTGAGTVTLQNSQCFTPPLGSYGGTANGYNVALNVLPNRGYMFLFGNATQTSFTCTDYGLFVNSTSTALFGTGTGDCGLKGLTKLSFASNQFTLSALDDAKNNKPFTMVLK